MYHLHVQLSQIKKKIEIKLVPELPRNILPDKLYKNTKREIKNAKLNKLY